MFLKKAFSIIELMIVVAIIAFLAAIAVPKIFNYYAKAKQAEVAINLASLHTAQQAYYAEHGTYSNILSGPGGIGWKPEGNFYYTYGFYFSGAQEGVNYFVGKLGTPPQNLSGSNATKDNFIAKSAGNVNSKSIDVWQIDESKKLEHVINGFE